MPISQELNNIIAKLENDSSLTSIDLGQSH